MKRTLTSIAAAGLVLGAMAPAAFAATTASPSYTKAGTVAFALNGTTVSNPYILDSQDSGNTTAFAPVFYFNQLLSQAGITATWDGNTHTWALTDSSIDASTVSVAGGVGSGNTTITLNGVTIKKINTFSAKDPAAGKNAQDTVYFPAYYVNNIFAAVGIQAKWDGTTGLSVSTAPAAFAVKSVTAVNPEEIDVTFTQPVDATQNFSGVTVAAEAGAVNPGALTYDTSADGKTLMIYSSTPLTQGGYYTVNVNNVLDAATRTVQAPYSTAIQVNDKTAPTISSIDGKTAQSSTTTFTISFSEPVLMDSVKVGDVYASATSADGGWDYTVALPGGATPLSAGQSYAVTIAGLRDLAGNYATNPLNTSVTIVQDTTKPTFTLVPVSPSEFNVVFSKKMTTSSVPVDAITVKNSAGNVLPLAGLPTFKSDNKTLDVKLAGSAIPSGFSSAQVSVEVKNLNDYLGNTVADTTNDLTLTKSTTQPTINSVRVIDATHVEVTFNEGGLTFNSAAGNTYKITDSTKAVAATVASASSEDANNRVVLTLAGSGLTYTDTFTLALVVGTVSDASGNVNAAGTTQFSYTAAPAAAVTAVVYGNTQPGGAASDSTSNRKIYVQYNQPDVISGISASTGNYKTGAADNSAAYTLDGAALPSGVVITTGTNAVTGNVYAVLDFSGVSSSNMPSEFANGGTGALTISGVQDASGGSLAYTSQTFTVKDTTAPTISTAYVSGSASAGYTVTLVMSEKVNSAAASDFLLKAGSTTVTPDQVTLSGTDATRVTLTVGTGNANFSTFKSNLGAITVALTGTGSMQDLASPANVAVAGSPVSAIDYATN